MDSNERRAVFVHSGTLVAIQEERSVMLTTQTAPREYGALIAMNDCDQGVKL
jgi:hypothetical protein